MIVVSGITARGRVRPRSPWAPRASRAMLSSVGFEHGRGVLAIVGSPADGTALLFDVLDGSVRASGGRVTLLGGDPEAVRSRIARVSLDAPLPDSLRVAEVCDLGGALRGDPYVPASERLGTLGVASLAERRVRSLAIEERRAVALAIALTSPKSEILLLEEPLAALESVAPRLVDDALRARALSASIVVSTTSARDAMRLGDALAVLKAGIFAPIPASNLGQLGRFRGGTSGGVWLRVVVSSAQGDARARVTALTAILGADPSVVGIETAALDTAVDGSWRSASIGVFGHDLATLSRAVTRSIARSRVDVDLVEPGPFSDDAVQSVAGRAVAPVPAGTGGSGAGPSGGAPAVEAEKGGEL